MLVFSLRKDEQAIMTLPDGRRVKVMICDIREKKVRVGFTAPLDIPIHREEVQRKIDEEAEHGR